MDDITSRIEKELLRLGADIVGFGGCMVCANACPAGAVSGILWEVRLYRDEFFDPDKCRKTARERARQGFGGENITICGKCIEVCPHTQKYINSTGEQG